MDFELRARTMLQTAEKELAALAAEAFTGLNYAAGMSIAEMARRVGDLGREPAPVGEPRTASESAAANYGLGAALARKPELTGRPTKLSPYPRFKREHDILVKIGYSKTDRSTYEHRSPRTVIQQLVSRVQQIGTSGHRFTTEELLPLKDQSDQDWPSYQVYLCLAWLVTEGLIERHGRQGYTVADVATLPAAADRAWLALPTR